MQRVSTYMRATKKVFKIVDTLSYHSKNLYNFGVYNTRQHFRRYTDACFEMGFYRPDIYSGIEFVGAYFPYARSKNHPHKDLSNYAFSKSNENYKLLYSDTAQQTLKAVDEAYISCFNKPGSRPPKYLDKNGRYKVTYPKVRIVFHGNMLTLGMSRAFRKQHRLTGKELTFPLPKDIKPHQIREVSLNPIHNGKCYKIEYTYSVPTKKPDLDKNKYLSIDLGLDNFVTMVENATGTAIILDGKYLKSINQWYNKNKAKLQSVKDKQGLQKQFTHRLSRLTIRRNNRIEDALNRYAHFIIWYTIEHRIGNVILPVWNTKQKINHGSVNNQNFTQIPHDAFRVKLRGKCELYGIAFHDEHDEAYTSQTDALSFDELQKQPYGRSRRIHRGLYRSSTGIAINADVNGALNHIRKVAGESPIKEIIGSGRFNRPVRIRLAYEVPPQCASKLRATLNCGDVVTCSTLSSPSQATDSGS